MEAVGLLLVLGFAAMLALQILAIAVAIIVWLISTPAGRISGVVLLGIALLISVIGNAAKDQDARTISSTITTMLVSHGDQLEGNEFRIVFSFTNTDNYPHTVNAIVGMRFVSPFWSADDIAGYGDGGSSWCTNDYLNRVAKSYCWNDSQSVFIPANSTIQVTFTLRGVNTMYAVPERLFNTPIEPTQICIAFYRIDRESDPYDGRVAMEQNSICQ